MSELTPGQRFYEGIRDHQGGECWLEHRGGCDGRLQAHHIYPKRLLIALHRRATLDVKLGKAGPIPLFDLDAALGDWRNGVLLCTRTHHYGAEHGDVRFDRGDMPIVLDGFERDYPFVSHYWPRIYRPGLDAGEAQLEGVIP